MKYFVSILALLISLFGCQTHSKLSSSATFNGIEAENFNNKNTGKTSLKADFELVNGEVIKDIHLDKSHILLLDGLISVSEGQLSIRISKGENEHWSTTFVSRSEEKFNNEIIELPHSGDYTLSILLENASGEYNIKWSEASKNLKNASQNFGSSSLSQTDEWINLLEKVKEINDSVTVGDMVIHNAFKHQLLAHSGSQFDSTVILENVYRPNQYVFDNCLSLIFGETNGQKFRPTGMNEWNRKLIDQHKDFIISKLSLLDSLDINQLFANHLQAVQKLIGRRGEGTWMVYFGPKDFQIFGGCDKNAMVLDIFGEAWNSKAINDLFAHEIEHLIFEPILENDQYGDTGLGITLDEGLAVYFTYKYLGQNFQEALYGQETQVLLTREKEIFKSLEPFLLKSNEEGCPIYRHCGRSSNCEPVVEGLPERIEDELCYFLGFRIIEKYVERNGEDSWKDLYEIPLIDFYEKSGYKEYVEQKN